MKHENNTFIHNDIDVKAGEVTTRIFTELHEGDRVIRKAQMDYLQKKETRRQFLTDFFWMLFEYGRPLPLDISISYLPCLVMAISFASKIGLIGRKQDLQRYLDLNKNQWGSFWKEATEKGLLLQKENAIYLNVQYFRKGDIQASSNFTRVFSDCFHTLYDEVAASQVKRRYLGYLLQMIPFLNRQTNMLSYNRTEQNSDHVICMTFHEYCDSIGYDRSHASTLRRQLSNFRVDGELIVGFFDDLSTLSVNGKYVLLNPKLCFGGDINIGGYENACALFAAEKVRRS